MRTALVALLLLTAALAGCSGKANGGGSDSDPTSSTPASSPGPASSTTTTTSSTQSSSPAPKANRAPVASIQSNATSGPAPLAVRFNLSATDADGDALTYVLSFGDGSANETGSLPTTVQHTFTSGNRTVRLVVSDGKASDEATVTVSVVQATLPAPATFTGTATGICQLPHPVTFETLCLPEGSGPIRHAFTMPAGVSKIVARLDWDFPVAQAADLDLSILDAAGATVAEGDCANLDPAPNPGVPDDVPEAGGETLFSCVRGSDEEAIVDGLALTATQSWTALVHPYQAPELDYTLTITFS